MVKPQLEALLWDIYGRERHQYKNKQRCKHHFHCGFPKLRLSGTTTCSHQNDIRKLLDMRTLLKDEIRLASCFLQQSLMEREQHRWQQKLLCKHVNALLHCIITEQSE